MDLARFKGYLDYQLAVAWGDKFTSSNLALVDYDTRINISVTLKGPGSDTSTYKMHMLVEEYTVMGLIETIRVILELISEHGYHKLTTLTETDKQEVI